MTKYEPSKNDLLERIVWILRHHKDEDLGLVAQAIIIAIEQHHRIINPDDVTQEMIEACFTALPKHYDPPDPSRRPWHALKARMRFTAMARSVKSILDQSQE